MRKAEKKEVLDLIHSFYQAHEEIKNALNHKKIISVQNMLSECQEYAIQLGEIIEKLEGEGHITVSYVEDYCEALFCVFDTIQKDGLNSNINTICKLLTKHLVKMENSLKSDIPVKKEVVFFPYKVSMWDSLESVYLAAREDPNCDVFCVPIPYYDLREDRTLGQIHYEGHEYPEGIEVTDWQTYNFEERRPDVIYIHNPYDDWNLVTSVHPRFYSENLKKYTDTLVYIPYYSTTGGMSDGQKLCPAYIYADYIILQAPGFRKYFDERIPDEKFLAFGSPKFDKIIKKCENPSELPSEWKEKIEGRKVYFYNTSLGGMLGETEDFMKKMRYVFSCFERREDACLLWRPHPLLESTFESMRPMYKQEYLAIKQEFFNKEIGIYDNTPDIEKTISFCDAYIGDAGTSVTSLFGVVGKPMFILNNRLHSEPEEDSWRGEINAGFFYPEKDRFSITQGNRLYISEAFKHDYKYQCNLSEYVYGGDYNVIYEIGKKLYVCPHNAQNILIIDEIGKKKKIEIDSVGIKGDLFTWSVGSDKYILLLPYKYPAMVQYNIVTGELKYLREHIDIFRQVKDGVIKCGGCGDKDGLIYLSSPIDEKIDIFDMETGKHTIVKMPIISKCGYRTMLFYRDDFWLLPYGGEQLNIVKWNPDTNVAYVYDQFPQGFRCIDPISGNECMERPFSSGAFCGDYIYLTPECANMYIKLNMITGEMAEWKPPFAEGEGKEYFYTTLKSTFLWGTSDGTGKVMIFSHPGRKLYEIDLTNDTYCELEVRFDVDELKAHEPGFCHSSEGLRYCCHENAFNSIRDFLNDDITGNQFDRKQQIEAYKEIASNYDGTCGAKVHEFMSRL